MANDVEEQKQFKIRTIENAVHDFFYDNGARKGTDDQAVQELMDQLGLDEATAREWYEIAEAVANGEDPGDPDIELAD